MALVFAPAANAVLAPCDPRSRAGIRGDERHRELGGVFGVAVLASVFSAHGSYASPHAYTAGRTAAIPVGAAILAIGALVALLVPGIRAGPRTERRPSDANSRVRGESDLGLASAFGQPANSLPSRGRHTSVTAHRQAMSTRLDGAADWPQCLDGSGWPHQHFL